MFKKRNFVSSPSGLELQPGKGGELASYLAERPAPNTCKVRTLFTGVKSGGSFCGRQVVQGYEFCYWHLPDTGKYSSTVLASYFGKEISLGEALEEEVKSGRSLENAFLPECHLGGSFLKKGPSLIGVRFTGANLRGHG